MQSIQANANYIEVQLTIPIVDYIANKWQNVHSEKCKMHILYKKNIGINYYYKHVHIWQY